VGGHTADGADDRGLRAWAAGAEALEEGVEVLLEALKKAAQKLVGVLLLTPGVLRVQRGDGRLEVLQGRVPRVKRPAVRGVVLGHQPGKAPAEHGLA